MKGITGCPRCGGEVEVVKLGRKKNETKDVYRIWCLHCKMTVARGTKFEMETVKQGQKRIEEYNAAIKEKFATPGSDVIQQNFIAKQRDRIASGHRSVSEEFGIEL